MTAYVATLTKGAYVQIVGEIQTQEYVAKDAVKKSLAEVRVRRRHFLFPPRLDG
jgi:single-stranded DNA-binding protein